MKIGDLVSYVENDMGGSLTYPGQEGLVIGGPRALLEDGRRHWEVYWMYCNKIGWWDEFRLEVVNECR